VQKKMNVGRDIKDILEDALKAINTNLGGNTEKVRELIQQFIDETPTFFNQVKDNIYNERWEEAASIIHRVKPRYGYLGLTSALETLTNWESELKSNPVQFPHSRSLDEIQKLNATVIDQLKDTNYYKTLSNEINPELPLSGKKVLIAEDDEINAMVFELFVTELGCEALLAKDGNEAVNLVNERNPDLIFMDVHMPHFSGLEAIRALRTKGINTPIISLSASTRLLEREQSMESGASGFLIKPAKRQTIHETLMKYLA
jgi:CheY-like chemotaxis protein